MTQSSEPNTNAWSVGEPHAELNAVTHSKPIYNSVSDCTPNGEYTMPYAIA